MLKKEIGNKAYVVKGILLAFMITIALIIICLILIAIIPVVETMSVIMQVVYFRIIGKRLFRMSPLHHHFELTGWRENRVVGVFSLVTLVAAGCAIFLV